MIRFYPACKFFFLAAVVVSVIFASVAQAQEAPPMPQAAPAAEIPAPPVAASSAASAPFLESLLFSQIEIAAILSATRGKPVGAAPLKAGDTTYMPPRRVISLAGVLFNKPGDWIVWLNGQKVEPKRLLPEIIDIEVHKDTVRLKWFDIGMNKIISISLRPHQTYDIVTGLLLPG